MDKAREDLDGEDEEEEGKEGVEAEENKVFLTNKFNIVLLQKIG